MQIGTLVANASTTTISNVHVVSGNVVGFSGNYNSQIGGMVGGLYNHSVIASSSAAVTVSDESDTGGTNLVMTGGLVGYLPSASVSESSATGPVSGNKNVGGLIGYAEPESSVSNSYASGKINGVNYIGGLIGYNNYAQVKNSYSVGIVSSGTATQIGGLIGYTPGSPTSVVNSYWDMETSGQTNSAGGSSKTTAQMYQQSTYVNWDFKTTWSIVENKSYPFLQMNH